MLRIVSFKVPSLANKTIEKLEFMKDEDIDIALFQKIWSNQTHHVIKVMIKEFGFESIIDPRDRHGGTYQ